MVRSASPSHAGLCPGHHVFLTSASNAWCRHERGMTQKGPGVFRLSASAGARPGPTSGRSRRCWRHGPKGDNRRRHAKDRPNADEGELNHAVTTRRLTAPPPPEQVCQWHRKLPIPPGTPAHYRRRAGPHLPRIRPSVPGPPTASDSAHPAASRIRALARMDEARCRPRLIVRRPGKVSNEYAMEAAKKCRIVLR